MEQTSEYIQESLLILVPVLYTLGVVLKRLKTIKDKYIPLFLTAIGIVLATIFEIASMGASFAAAFAGMCQGVLCAGTAVYANQMYKQTKKEDT